VCFLSSNVHMFFRVSLALSYHSPPSISYNVLIYRNDRGGKTLQWPRLLQCDRNVLPHSTVLGIMGQAFSPFPKKQKSIYFRGMVTYLILIIYRNQTLAQLGIPSYIMLISNGYMREYIYYGYIWVGRHSISLPWSCVNQMCRVCTFHLYQLNLAPHQPREGHFTGQLPFDARVFPYTFL